MLVVGDAPETIESKKKKKKKKKGEFILYIVLCLFELRP